MKTIFEYLLSKTKNKIFVSKFSSIRDKISLFNERVLDMIEENADDNKFAKIIDILGVLLENGFEPVNTYGGKLYYDIHNDKHEISSNSKIFHLSGTYVLNKSAVLDIYNLENNYYMHFECSRIFLKMSTFDNLSISTFAQIENGVMKPKALIDTADLNDTIIFMIDNRIRKLCQ